MKVLLALSLLLFLHSVFSLGDIFPCPTFAKCPKGYTPQYSGRNGLNAVCTCKKDAKAISRCTSALISCLQKPDPTCYNIESICSPTEILTSCDQVAIPIRNICDRASQRARKENYAKTQQTCEFYRDRCNRMIGDHCYRVAHTCDPDTTIQLCKNERISSEFICQEAEIQKEKDRAEGTKYSCDYAQALCLTNKLGNVCSDIAKFCDVDTAAKWCYKDDTNQIDKISDEDCSKVVKKSQYLMFGQSKEECWKQVSLCEGGNSEACMQVPTLCVKEVVSALCNAKKITSKRICTHAVLEETTSSSYPGCKFFEDKCNYREKEYCQLASRYCDDETIGDLCRMFSIEDVSICKRVSAGVGILFRDPINSIIQLPNSLGF